MSSSRSSAPSARPSAASAARWTYWRDIAAAQKTTGGVPKGRRRRAVRVAEPVTTAMVGSGGGNLSPSALNVGLGRRVPRGLGAGRSLGHEPGLAADLDDDRLLAV